MVAEASRASRVGERRGGRADSVRRRQPQAGVLFEAQPCEQETRRNGTGPQTRQTARLGGGRKNWEGTGTVWPGLGSLAVGLRAGGVQVRLRALQVDS